jgi:hypothetical protein
MMHGDDCTRTHAFEILQLDSRTHLLIISLRLPQIFVWGIYYHKLTSGRRPACSYAP